MKARQVAALIFSAQAVSALLEANQTNTSTTTSTMTTTSIASTTTSNSATSIVSSTTAGVTGPPAFVTSSAGSSLGTNTSTSTTTSPKTTTSSTADGASAGSLPSQIDSNASTTVVTTTAGAAAGTVGGSANANASTTTTTTNSSSMYSQYVVGEWSECSSECGEGRRTRAVTCPLGAGACTGIAPISEEVCNASSECSNYWPIMLLVGAVLLLPCCALLAFKLRCCHRGAAGAAAEEESACGSTETSAAVDMAALEAGLAKADVSSPKQVAATAAAVIGSSHLVGSPVAAAVTKSPVVQQQLVQMVAAPSRVVRIIKGAPQTVGVAEQTVMHSVMPSHGSYPSTLPPVPQQLYAVAAQAGSPINATGMTAALPAVQQTTRGSAWSHWLQTANGETHRVISSI